MNEKKITFTLEDIKPQLSEKEIKYIEDVITTARITNEMQKVVFETAGIVTYELVVLPKGQLMRMPKKEEGKTCETCGQIIKEVV